MIQDVPFRTAWGWARDGLRAVAEHADANGVRVGLEGEGNTLVATSANELEMIADVDRPGSARSSTSDTPTCWATTTRSPPPPHSAPTLSTATRTTTTDYATATMPSAVAARLAAARTRARAASYEGAITVEVGAPNPDGVAADGKALLVEHLLPLPT